MGHRCEHENTKPHRPRRAATGPADADSSRSGGARAAAAGADPGTRAGARPARSRVGAPAARGAPADDRAITEVAGGRCRWSRSAAPLLHGRLSDPGAGRPERDVALVPTKRAGLSPALYVFVVRLRRPSSTAFERTPGRARSGRRPCPRPCRRHPRPCPSRPPRYRGPCPSPRPTSAGPRLLSP